MTLPIVFAIAGFIFLGIGLFGRIKINTLELPPIPKSARVASAALGAVLIPASIVLFWGSVASSPPPNIQAIGTTPTRVGILSGGTDFLAAFPPQSSPDSNDTAFFPVAGGTAEANDSGE